MARPSNPQSRQLACLMLIVLGISYSTKAGFGFDLAANHYENILTTATNETLLYTVHTEELTWDEARQKCIEDGGHLAVIDTLEKARLVGELKPYDCYVWVGITRSNSSEAWTSVHDGSPVSNVPWAPNQPSGSHNCLTVQGCNRGLGDEDCAARKGFVCEKKPKAKCSISGSMSLQQVCQRFAPAAVTPEKNCSRAATIREGYAPMLNSNVAYKVYDDIQVTWQQAQKLCKREGARLAVPDNQEILKHLGRRNPEGLHIGIFRWFEKWISLRDRKEINFLPWHVNEPAGSPQCVATAGVSGELKNVRCDRWIAHYVCEVSIPQKHL